MNALNKTVSVNEFRSNLKQYADEVQENHEPVLVTRRNGHDFVVISKEDYDSQVETLYVTQDTDLMKQISESLITSQSRTGIIKPEKDLEL